MLMRWFTALILCALLSHSTIVANAQTTLPHSSHIAGELLIAPRSGVSDAELEGVYNGHGGQKIRILAQINVHHIRVSESALDAIEAALSKNPKVASVEKNFIAQANLVPNDPNFTNQWFLQKVSAPSAWDLSTGSSSVVVAVIDSGVDPSHPDLVAKLVSGYNFIGAASDTHDVLGHGTAVAGVIGADTNSGMGVAGLGWNTSVMPIVVVNSNNSATYANIAAAITYAADHGAKVINMSLGGTSYSSTLQSAVDYAWSKGVVVVAAAGNNASNAAFYPAALNNVVAVAATDNTDAPASFSNFGNWIAVAAPGTSIQTTTNGGGYGNWQGTSFASPQVAALAALILARNPGLINQQIVDLIKANADDQGAAGFDPYYGWGRINAYRAVQAAPSIPNLSIAIASPASGSQVSGAVSVTTSVASQNPVADVEFYIDGALYTVDSSSPYGFVLDTTALSGSPHTVFAKVYDVYGNSATSTSITLTIGPADTVPPDVQITGIAYDGKNLSITASATDQQSRVTKVEFYVDGKLKATDNSAPWSVKFNAKPLGSGSHLIQAKGYDSAGNVGVSSSVSVTTK